ncbi:protein-disulfide reductase DsbD [bacterium]|nr:protein-disulfide reductase DsbD [bacterium]
MRNIVLSALFLSLAAALSAQVPDDVVQVKTETSPAMLKAGERGELRVTFSIADGYHIGDAAGGFFKVVPAAAAGIAFSDPVYPKSIEDPYGDYYADEVIVTVPFLVEENASGGLRTFPVAVGYQPCSEEGVCYMPQESTVGASVEIAGGEAAGETETITRTGGMAGRLTGALERGSLIAFLIVFLGGMLTSLTPCVYPMIPITIAVIGAQAEGGKLKGFILSLFYVLGLAATFTTLGIIAARTGALFGSVSQHPAAILIISLIFFLMGLSMLGVFTVRMPSSIATRLQGKRRRGFLGAFLTGLVAGLVVSPCVSPLLVVILAWVAKTGSVLLGAGLLFSFSLGLGVLFILIGTFSGMLKNLPKSGGWMEVVERGFGILLVTLALIFARPLLSPFFYRMAMAAGLIVAGIFFGAVAPYERSASAKVKLLKAAGLFALFVAFSLIFISFLPAGVSGPAAGARAEQPARMEDAWLDSDVQGFAVAAEEEKKVIVDFFAEWCAACHELDEKTWPDPGVDNALAQYVKVKLDLTRNDAADKALQKKYGVLGLPTVIIFDAGGKELGRFEGFQPPEKVVAFLKQLR